MLRAVLFPVLLLVGLVPAPAPAQGAEAARIEPLYQALAMPDILQIMRLEGLEYGRELAQELFAGQSNPGWSGTVSEIYDVERLDAVVRAALLRELEGHDLAPMVAFFESDLGARIIGLEMSARTAILEPEIESLAQEVLDTLRYENPPRLALLEAFEAANDLIENNVVGAMNSNYAFYVGLSEGGAFGEAFAEEDIIADVWSQEATIRVETEDWLMAYLALAYQPLTDAELREYVAFSRTGAGIALNRAIFDAFDDMYVAVSMALGAAAADYMAGKDL